VAKLYTNRGKTWEYANSWWVLLTLLPIAMGSFIAFLYAGSTAKNKRWKIFGYVYLVLFVLLFIPDTDTSVGLFLALWIVTIVHAFKIRPAYLVQLDILKANEHEIVSEEISRLRQEAEERLGKKVQPPQRQKSKGFDGAQQSMQQGFDGGQQSIDQGFDGTQQFMDQGFNGAQQSMNHGFNQQPVAPFTPLVKAAEEQTIEKIDINTASETELAAIPTIGIILAKKVVIKRQELGSFQSFEQFSQIMGLNEHTIERLRDQVYFSQVQNQKMKTGRMIDY
jgi:competence ComEA-like helix-hairpin-helix protein